MDSPVIFIIGIILILMCIFFIMKKEVSTRINKFVEFTKSLSNEDIECFLRHPSSFSIYEYRLLKLEKARRILQEMKKENEND